MIKKHSLKPEKFGKIGMLIQNYLFDFFIKIFNEKDTVLVNSRSMETEKAV